MMPTPRQDGRRRSSAQHPRTDRAARNKVSQGSGWRSPVIDLVVRGARLAGADPGAATDLHVDDGRFVAVTPAGGGHPPARTVIEAPGAPASAPHLAPPVHPGTPPYPGP